MVEDEPGVLKCDVSSAGPYSSFWGAAWLLSKLIFDTEAGVLSSSSAVSSVVGHIKIRFWLVGRWEAILLDMLDREGWNLPLGYNVWFSGS